MKLQAYALCSIHAKLPLAIRLPARGRIDIVGIEQAVLGESDG